MDVRASFPLTLCHLGDAGPTVAGADAFVRAVCDAHPRGDIPSRAVRDLVRYEGLVAQLQPATLAPGPAPPEDARVVLASYVRVLVYGAALPEMLAALREGRPARARPARGWIVAWRDEKGELREHLLPREEGWLLESFREPTLVSEAVEDDEDRARFATLWRLGILVRAP